MYMNNEIQVAKVLKRGIGFYKSSFASILKYSFLAVLVSSMLSIYLYLNEILAEINEVLYVVGLILLVLLILPIIYYSVRVVATSVGKLKAIVLNENYDYKEKYKLTRDIFWRVMLVAVLKFLVFILFTVACILPAIAISEIFFSDINFFTNIEPVIQLVSLGISLLIALLSIYLFVKLEFATTIIYWNVETEYSDVMQSMRMTKYHFFKKVIIILIAQLPNLILAGVTFVISMIFNGFIGMTMFGFFNLVITIAISTFIFTWTYSIYLALFEEMKVFSCNQSEKADIDGREWLSF